MLGEAESVLEISEEWLDEEVEIFRLQEEKINNVRRNVDPQQHSLPLTSSATSVLVSVTSLLSLLSMMVL